MHGKRSSQKENYFVSHVCFIKTSAYPIFVLTIIPLVCFYSFSSGLSASDSGLSASDLVCFYRCSSGLSASDCWAKYLVVGLTIQCYEVSKYPEVLRTLYYV